MQLALPGYEARCNGEPDLGILWKFEPAEKSSGAMKKMCALCLDSICTTVGLDMRGPRQSRSTET
jgi:hypothetical protein